MTARRALALLVAAEVGFFGWHIGRGVWRYDPAMPWRRV